MKYNMRVRVWHPEHGLIADGYQLREDQEADREEFVRLLDAVHSNGLPAGGSTYWLNDTLHHIGATLFEQCYSSYEIVEVK